jgi:hypothetical protein
MLFAGLSILFGPNLAHLCAGTNSYINQNIGYA